MGRFVERMPARRVLIERHMYGKLPGLMELPLDENPAGIDALWGWYYATGSPEPIRRLIATLAWSTDDKDVDRLTAGNMTQAYARSQRDARSRAPEHHEAGGDSSDEGDGAALGGGDRGGEETYETSKIRKEALTLINDLKQKGSGTKRNVSFAGDRSRPRWRSAAWRRALSARCRSAYHASSAVPAPRPRSRCSPSRSSARDLMSDATT